MANRMHLLTIPVSMGIVGCFLTWLLMTDTSSPLQGYLLYNPWLRNFWGNLIFPVFAIGVIFGLPDSDFVGYPLVFLQWFVIGCLGILIAKGIKKTIQR